MWTTSQQRPIDEIEACTQTVLAIVGRCVSDAVVVAGPDATVSAANPSCERVLGRAAATLIGRSLPGVLTDLVGVERLHALVRVASQPVESSEDAPTAVTASIAVDGSSRSVDLRMVRLGGIHLLVVAPSSGVVDDPSHSSRLTELETGLRNIGWELQAMGFSLRPEAQSGSPIQAEQLRNLSRREREVLDAFVQGLSVVDSAEALHVSEHTIRSHLKAIYRKLGVRSQTELIRRMRDGS